MKLGGLLAVSPDLYSPLARRNCLDPLRDIAVSAFSLAHHRFHSGHTHCETELLPKSSSKWRHMRPLKSFSQPPRVEATGLLRMRVDQLAGGGHRVVPVVRVVDGRALAPPTVYM
jgi:hypothetical protein